MKKTLEQREADEALEKAVLQCLGAYDIFHNSDVVMTEFVCAVEGQSWDDDGNSFSDLGLLFRGGQMKNSTAIGLLMQALDLIRKGDRPLE